MHRTQQTFPIAQLQQLADKHGMTKHNVEIETQRCESDLLYALFRRPHTVLNRLLPGLLEIAMRKNSPDIERVRLIEDGKRFLLEHRYADTRIKVFVVLRLLNRDSEAQDVFRAGYADGNLWGSAAEGCAHLTRFLVHLAQLMEDLHRQPFGETNVQHIVREFVVACEQHYLSKT